MEDILYLRSNAMIGRVDIYRMTGGRVSSISGLLSSLDMSSVESGMYLLKIYTKEGVLYDRIIRK